MTNKRRLSLIHFLKNFIFIVPNLFNLMNRVVMLSAYEAKLAVKSLVIVFLLSFVIGALATTTWLGLLVMLYIYLTSIQWTPMASVSIVVLVNVVMLIILILIVFRLKKRLEFSATRQQLQVIKRIYREV